MSQLEQNIDVLALNAPESPSLELVSSAVLSLAGEGEFGFDFSLYEQEVADIDFEEQAIRAFSDILTFESDDQSHRRTIEDIKKEVAVFFSNPEVQILEEEMNRFAQIAEAFCTHHGVSYEDIGMNLGNDFSENDGHDHAGHDKQDNDDDDDEIDPKTGKKKKKKRRGWLRTTK